MTRRPYRPRQYLYACPRCKQWSGVKTLDEQAACRQQGACPRCQRDDGWLARVRIAAIEEHLARLVTLGRAAPECDKARLRALYVKKQAHLQAARMAVDEGEVVG